MKIEGYVFHFIAVFLAVTAAVYWFTSNEPAGTAMLVFGAGLGVIVGSFTYLAGRRLGGPRPEDRNDAEVAEGAGEYGFFSPHSWWPLPTAFFSALAVLGVVYGWWLFLIGGVGLMISLIGLLYEYYYPGVK